jgi:hypothetical protein
MWICSIETMSNLTVASLEAVTTPGLQPTDMERSSSGGVMARLTISLPRTLYREFRLHALEMDTTMSALVARLIREELGS